MQGVITTRQWHACSPWCASGLFVTSVLCPFLICSKTVWWESFQHHLGKSSVKMLMMVGNLLIPCSLQFQL